MEWVPSLPLLARLCDTINDLVMVRAPAFLYTRADTDHTTVDPAIAAIISSCAVCVGLKTLRTVFILVSS